jgi:hypothetical protein
MPDKLRSLAGEAIEPKIDGVRLGNLLTCFIEGDFGFD